VKLGGILEHTMREIELECLPKSIPDSVDVDVSHLEIDMAIHLSDITLPPDTTTSLDGALSVALVAVPKIEEEEVAEVVEGEEGEGEGDGEGDAGDDDKADAGGKAKKSD
jgi:large subunit ribosomal protein L25